MQRKSSSPSPADDPEGAFAAMLFDELDEMLKASCTGPLLLVVLVTVSVPTALSPAIMLLSEISALQVAGLVPLLSAVQTVPPLGTLVNSMRPVLKVLPPLVVTALNCANVLKAITVPAVPSSSRLIIRLRRLSSRGANEPLSDLFIAFITRSLFAPI